MVISSWALWDEAASWALRTELSDVLCMRSILLLNKKNFRSFLFSLWGSSPGIFVVFEASMLTSQTETPRREEWWFRLSPLKRADVLRRAMGASTVD